MVKAMSLKIEVLAPGRYIAATSCRADHNGIYQCKIAQHFDNEQKHYEVVAYYHIPHLGVITIRAHSAEEADKNSRVKIYEGLARIYLAHSKLSMELEKLMKEAL